jgi:hypothetical protein
MIGLGQAEGDLETELHPTAILLSLSSLSYVLLFPSGEGGLGAGLGRKKRWKRTALDRGSITTSS